MGQGRRWWASPSARSTCPRPITMELYAAPSSDGYIHLAILAEGREPIIARIVLSAVLLDPGACGSASRSSPSLPEAPVRLAGLARGHARRRSDLLRTRARPHPRLPPARDRASADLPARGLADGRDARLPQRRGQPRPRGHTLPAAARQLTSVQGSPRRLTRGSRSAPLWRSAARRSARGRWRGVGCSRSWGCACRSRHWRSSAGAGRCSGESCSWVSPSSLRRAATARPSAAWNVAEVRHPASLTATR